MRACQVNFNLTCIHNVYRRVYRRKYMGERIYVRYKKDGKWTWRPATAHDILNRSMDLNDMKIVEEE